MDNPAEAISATTAGRSPSRTPCIIDNSLYLKYSHARNETMIQDGSMHPMVDTIAPPTPAIRIPTKVAELIAIGPGVIWDMVIKSINSVVVSQ